MLAISPYDPHQQPPVRVTELPDPSPAPGEVLVEVRAAGLNRADLLQVRGLYPPPPGESTVPGLECAGVIKELAPDVVGWSAGDRVMALLAGGGHGERVVVPVGQLMPLPQNLSFNEGGALPEVALTSWTNLVVEGGLEAGQKVLIAGAASGVGTFAVQLARELGATVLVTGRNLERLRRLEPQGAQAFIRLGRDLSEEVRASTGGEGVDLILDLLGGEHLQSHLEALKPQGRLVLVGLTAGRSAEVDLGTVLRNRLEVRGSVLRARSRAEKSALVASFREFAHHRLESGALKAVVDRTYPLSEAADAYEALTEGGIWGKLVLNL